MLGFLALCFLALDFLASGILDFGYFGTLKFLGRGVLRLGILGLGNLGWNPNKCIQMKIILETSDQKIISKDEKKDKKQTSIKAKRTPKKRDISRRETFSSTI